MNYQEFLKTVAGPMKAVLFEMLVESTRIENEEDVTPEYSAVADEIWASFWAIQKVAWDASHGKVTPYRVESMCEDEKEV